MDVVKVLLLSNLRKRMYCGNVFCRDYVELMRKQTLEIHATRKIAESSCVVKIHEGTVDVLVEHEHI